MKKMPQYMLIYQCEDCRLDSGFTEGQRVECHYCNRPDKMKLLSRKKITKKVVNERLKTLADRMFSNLKLAYETMPDELKKNYSLNDPDLEKEMLLLLENAKKFRSSLDATAAE